MQSSYDFLFFFLFTEVEEIVEVDSIPPEDIHIPNIYVQREREIVEMIKSELKSKSKP